MRAVSSAQASTLRTSFADADADGSAELEPRPNTFRIGDHVVYAYEIYDGLRGEAELLIASRILRDGHVVHERPFAAIRGARTRDAVDVLPMGGELSLEALSPGSYSLEAVVGRRNDDEVKTLAVQSSDFEVVTEPR